MFFFLENLVFLTFPHEKTTFLWSKVMKYFAWILAFPFLVLERPTYKPVNPLKLKI